MNVDVIDKILSQDNYTDEAFLARGVNPSDAVATEILRKATEKFLVELKSGFDAAENQVEFVTKLVDELPWFDLDREEKDFLADVLAPAIESIGLDPWQIY